MDCGCVYKEGLTLREDKKTFLIGDNFCRYTTERLEFWSLREGLSWRHMSEGSELTYHIVSLLCLAGKLVLEGYLDFGVWLVSFTPLVELRLDKPSYTYNQIINQTFWTIIQHQSHTQSEYRFLLWEYSVQILVKKEIMPAIIKETCIHHVFSSER